MLNQRFRGYSNFIFDLDGTFWRWDALIPGAKATYQELVKEGKNVFFVTNNCMLTRKGLAAKLRRFGVAAEERHLINPAVTTTKAFRGKKVYAIAEGIKQEFKAEGARLTDKADIVWISEDRKFNFEKLSKACELIFAGAKGYKNASGGLWFEGKRKLPGSGALAAAIEVCTRKEMKILGKQSVEMAAYVKSLGLKGQTLAVGDECASDMLLGNSCGFDTALVLTGRDTLKEARKARGLYKPKYVLKSVAALRC